MQTIMARNKKNAKHRGRPPVHKPEENKRLMTRTTEEEYDIWTKAAEKAARDLGIPNLTIGPWSRMVLNQAAKALGVTGETPVVDRDTDQD